MSLVWCGQPPTAGMPQPREWHGAVRYLAVGEGVCAYAGECRRRDAVACGRGRCECCPHDAQRLRGWDGGDAEEPIQAGRGPTALRIGPYGPVPGIDAAAKVRSGSITANGAARRGAPAR